MFKQEGGMCQLERYLRKMDVHFKTR